MNAVPDSVPVKPARRRPNFKLLDAKDLLLAELEARWENAERAVVKLERALQTSRRTAWLGVGCALASGFAAGAYFL